MGCDGNCDSCEEKDPPSQVNKSSYPSRVREEIPMGELLQGPPKPRADDTPLEELCNCENGVRLARSKCLPCIRSWVNATCNCKVEKQIEKYKSISTITTDRLVNALKEKQEREANRVHSVCNDCCGDCSHS